MRVTKCEKGKQGVRESGTVISFSDSLWVFERKPTP